MDKQEITELFKEYAALNSIPAICERSVPNYKGDDLVEVRRRLNVTKETFAEIIGVSTTWLWKYEKRETLPFQVRCTIHHFYNEAEEITA